MIVSESKSFIYTRIPKTGSTSVSMALEPYRRASDASRVGALARRLVPGVKKPFAVNFRAHPHWPLMAAKEVLPTSFFESTYKFTVVRNPVSWCISLHNHILRNKHLPRFARLYHDIYDNSSFDFFVSTLLETPIPPQVGMITDTNGDLMINAAVRLENVSDEIQQVFSLLSIKSELQELNKGKYHRPPQISSESMEIIKIVYDVDYATFGYSSDGSTSGPVDLGISLPMVGNWIGAIGGFDYRAFMRDQQYSNRPESQQWYRV